MEVFMGNWSVNWRCCCPSMSIVRYRKQCPQTQTLGGWGWNFHETSWFLGQTRTLWADRRFGVLRTWVEKSCAYHLTHLEAPLEQEVLLPRLMDWFPPRVVHRTGANCRKVPQTFPSFPIIFPSNPGTFPDFSIMFQASPDFPWVFLSFSTFPGQLPQRQMHLRSPRAPRGPCGDCGGPGAARQRGGASGNGAEVLENRSVWFFFSIFWEPVG